MALYQDILPIDASISDSAGFIKNAISAFLSDSEDEGILQLKGSRFTEGLMYVNHLQGILSFITEYVAEGQHPQLYTNQVQRAINLAPLLIDYVFDMNGLPIISSSTTLYLIYPANVEYFRIVSGIITPQIPSFKPNSEYLKNKIKLSDPGKKLLMVGTVKS